MDPLLRKVDCVQIPVPDLDAGLRFYRDGLGLELKWRHATQAGLRLDEPYKTMLWDYLVAAAQSLVNTLEERPYDQSF